jgi:hypothetical protein
MPLAQAAFDPAHFWTADSLSKIVFGSAVVTTVINVTWFGISNAVRAIIRVSRRAVIPHHVVLGQVSREKFDTTLKPISLFYCLLVRYGTDSYIEKLASDEERHEGRLRLKLIPVDVESDNSGNVFFVLKLPVHKRLGTQFKCFAAVTSMNEVQKVVEILQACAHVKDVKQSDSQYKNRIYFLLDHFAVVDSIDNIKNNFVYAQ